MKNEETVFFNVSTLIKCAYDEIVCMMLSIHGKHEISSLCKGGMMSEMCALVKEQKTFLNLQCLQYKNVFHHYRHISV